MLDTYLTELNSLVVWSFGNRIKLFSAISNTLLCTMLQWISCGGVEMPRIADARDYMKTN